ncbi:MAG: cytochrome c3 family protein [Thermodesulfobacteriota bacterium]|nr:cytochrome c3 family protein [Thermodesulfobacteriota bacterium]
MELKTERIIAYCLGAILLVVGVVCYAAFPHTSPENPIRIMFKVTAGNVLFDHSAHAEEDGYGIECIDCHHDLEDDMERPSACGECHEVDSEDSVNRADAFHMQCIGCHEDAGEAPSKCAECHAM